MKITRIQTTEIHIPLITPFKTALRTAEEVNDILVRISTDTDAVGYGEAPPTAVITGDTKGSVKSAIQEYIAPSITGMEVLDLESISRAISGSIQKNTSAKAAVDMAVYDLYAQALGQPLYKVLGGAREEIETDLTISIGAPDKMVYDSLRAVSRGYHTLKVKIGADSVLDLERLKQIRQAVGPKVTIRADANQGWTAKQAVRNIAALEDAGVGLELVEQPVPAHDIQGLAYVTEHSQTPILADESMFSPKDALTLLQLHAADYLNIKLMKTGGIHEALKICTLADLYGVECMMGCMLESRIAVSAAAHLCAAVPCITRADLDGPGLCRTDPYEGGPSFQENRIVMNTAPGLGFTKVPGFEEE